MDPSINADNVLELPAALLLQGLYAGRLRIEGFELVHAVLDIGIAEAEVRQQARGKSGSVTAREVVLAHHGAEALNIGIGSIAVADLDFGSGPGSPSLASASGLFGISSFSAGTIYYSSRDLSSRITVKKIALTGIRRHPGFAGSGEFRVSGLTVPLDSLREASLPLGQLASQLGRSSVTLSSVLRADANPRDGSISHSAVIQSAGLGQIRIAYRIRAVSRDVSEIQRRLEDGNLFALLTLPLLSSAEFLYEDDGLAGPMIDRAAGSWGRPAVAERAVDAIRFYLSGDADLAETVALAVRGFLIGGNRFALRVKCPDPVSLADISRMARRPPGQARPFALEASGS